MEQVLRIIKKIIPQPIFDFFQPAYHLLLGYLGALIYGFPSEKLIVIGVTGTKGKTTTCNLIAQILNFSGLKTGMATTVNFRIGNEEWINTSKQTMLGRFQLQKLISEMVKNGCKYAVIETSSEGILQYRHRFIDYDIAVFTNLSPEHIERHGSFENYRIAKIKLFEQVAKKLNGVGIYNLDDENVGCFLKPKIAKQYVYTLKLKKEIGQIKNLYRISDVKSTASGSSFSVSGTSDVPNIDAKKFRTSDVQKLKLEMPLIGEFNVYNAGAAICVALSQKVYPSKIKRALLKAKAPAGRFELVNKGQNFNVIIDYAHEPASLETIYKTIINSKLKTKNSKLICLLGSQGGGRDKWKRPEMGKISAQYCDKIILTNEDSYDEPPLEILNQIEEGIRINQQNQHKSAVYKIIDRREAIQKALSLAKKDDAVILTGKAGEVWMCVEGGKKIVWNERKIIKEEIDKLKI